MISKIILDTHVIEKGLTMPEFRFGFGQDRLLVLLGNIIGYFEAFDKSEPQLLHSLSVVDEYFEVHDSEGYAVTEELLEAISKLSHVLNDHEINIKRRDQLAVSKMEFFSSVEKSFFEFSNSRSSVRNFSGDPVCFNDIEDALDLCRNTPSACNRQSVRVHLYSKKSDMEAILRVQGGNRGFGHLAGSLIIVTYESSKYFEESERNSGIVDGGMYCMNILYALHARKIAACILNAAHDGSKDLAMRKEANIPDSEVFVAMIACGYAPDKFKIATSFRYPLDSILSVH